MFSLPPPKKVTVHIYPLEKYILRYKPLGKITIKGSLDFYVYTPVWIKNGIAQYEK